MPQVCDPARDEWGTGSLGAGAMQPGVPTPPPQINGAASGCIWVIHESGCCWLVGLLLNGGEGEIM